MESLIMIGLSAVLVCGILGAAGGILRLTARIAGASEEITLRHAIGTAFLAALAALLVTSFLRRLGWTEQMSLWILAVCIQGWVIKSRFHMAFIAALAWISTEVHGAVLN
ncbi:MAG: hypothetical protein ACE15E_25215 [Acidobacteriota bacterium]